MRAGYVIIGALWLAVTPTVLVRSYLITDTFIGCDFFSTWKWETFNDPTHGRVNYVDQTTAKNTNLSFASNDKFIMRADSFKNVSASSRGRDSIRIASMGAYAEPVMVLDLEHMPQGCATWPAWWTLSSSGPWPQGGEIDIIEGVNDNTKNLASLHTSPRCGMVQTRSQSGKTVSTDCDASVNYNQGCGTSFNKADSYGTGFNDNGGGWYVMQKSRTEGINVWFWSRNDPSVPPEIRDGFAKVSPGPSWGIPEASFPCDACDYDSHFDKHQMIFDLTFCGDWAGSAFSSSGCGPGSCEDFVNNYPDAFKEAYWEINALRVYT